jgi:hypothetical protein
MAGMLPAALSAADLILYHVNEMHVLDADKISYQGHVGGKPLSVTLSLQQSGPRSFLVADADAGSSPAAHIKIDVTDFSHLDFTRPAIYAEEEGGSAEVLVEMRYGDARDCYINDTGRDRLTIVLETDEGSRAYVENYEGCAISTRDLVPIQR